MCTSFSGIPLLKVVKWCIYKFSKEFSSNTYVPFLSAYEKAMGENEYYESVIKLIAMLETKEIRAKRLTGQRWYEIDNIQDLDIAESIFEDSDEKRLEKISGRYGGYWRYPKLLDFCYLVNPYYPPEKMREEIRSNFDVLLTQYPSGMRVNSLLASNNFGIKEEHIVVGNGAAELIKSLMENMTGRIGCIFPTFQEYPNRYNKDEIVAFYPYNYDFRYTEDDLISFFDDKDIKSLIMINPDNPSGNYISKEGLFRLIEWSKEKGISLIIDESFVDFVDDGLDDNSVDRFTVITEDILSMYNKLYVVKSISKSYGVPGLRLGIIASSDEETIKFIKKDVSIWNINSFGEFYMQIMEKYKKDYIEAIKLFKTARRTLIAELKNFDWIRVMPTQANYVMCELSGITSKELCSKLLKRNVYIKDLTEKIGNGNQYIRIAVRDEEDNDKLLSELSEII